MFYLLLISAGTGQGFLSHFAPCHRQEVGRGKHPGKQNQISWFHTMWGYIPHTHIYNVFAIKHWDNFSKVDESQRLVEPSAGGKWWGTVFASLISPFFSLSPPVIKLYLSWSMGFSCFCSSLFFFFPCPPGEKVSEKLIGVLSSPLWSTHHNCSSGHLRWILSVVWTLL